MLKLRSVLDEIANLCSSPLVFIFDSWKVHVGVISLSCTEMGLFG